jgi:hypothetical protein
MNKDDEKFEIALMEQIFNLFDFMWELRLIDG